MDIKTRRILGLVTAIALAPAVALAADEDEAEALDRELWAGEDPPRFWMIGVTLERADDNFVGKKAVDDQLIGLSLVYRWNYFGFNTKLMFAPRFGTGNLVQQRLYFGLGARGYYRYGTEWSFGAGIVGEARLRDHFTLLYVTPAELGASIWEDGSLSIKLFVGMRVLLSGGLVNQFLLDPNGFNNENAQDALTREKDKPVEGFINITFGRKID